MKTTVPWLLLVFILLCQPLLSQSSQLIGTIDSILPKDTLANQKTNSGALFENNIFYKELLVLKAYLLDETKLNEQFNGKISFGLNGQEVKNSNFFVISTGIELSKGTYPFTFDLSSSFQAQIQNGALLETVSNLSISFDYNYSEKHVGQESYVFLTATNNSFLGIDQRYEIGGGLIFNLYSAQKYITKGTPRIKANRTDGPLNYGLTEAGQVKLIGKNQDSILSDTSFNKEVDELRLFSEKSSEMKNLKKARKQFTNNMIKQYSTTRLSLLAGVNYELEQTADSMELFNGDLIRRGAFDATNRFRFVLRPGFAMQGGNFKFKSTAYFKLGIINEFKNEVRNGPAMDKKADYWTEWTNSLNFKFTEKIGLSIVYSLFYDNAPNRLFFNVSDNTTPDFRLFEAEKVYRFMGFNFNYRL
ncbi:MAG: hypothetical protein HKO09_03015 [Croceitalea sp.]|nr:hypothetical protein [Croceitalea sp.]